MKYVFYGLVIATLVFGGFLFLGNRNVDVGSLKSASITDTSQNSKVVKYSASITNRSYSPKRIDVSFGATVELTVKNNDNEQHGLSLSDFGVNDFIGPLQTKTVRFVANRKGESATFCSTTHPEKLIINVN